MKKEKLIIIIIISLLGIGFAAISTSLVINGTLKAEGDPKQYVFFTYDGLSTSNISSISGEGEHTLEFSTNALVNIGDNASVEFKVKNNSKYSILLDKIDCNIEGDYKDNFSLSGNDRIDNTVLSPNSETGLQTLMVTLNKSLDKKESNVVLGTISCSIDASFYIDSEPIVNNYTIEYHNDDTTCTTVQCAIDELAEEFN